MVNLKIKQLNNINCYTYECVCESKRVFVCWCWFICLFFYRSFSFVVIASLFDFYLSQTIIPNEMNCNETKTDGIVCVSVYVFVIGHMKQKKGQQSKNLY